MKLTSKVTDNWWMIFKCFPPEPFGLWRLYALSILVTLLLFLVAGFCAYYRHGSLTKEPTINCKALNCIPQKLFWDKLRLEANENRLAACNRLQLLKKIRNNPDDKNFGKSWSWFETEINALKKIIEKPQKYRVASISNTFPKIVFLVLLSLLFFVLINRLVLLHAKSMQDYFLEDEITQNFIRDWTLPQIMIGFLIAFSMTGAEFSTSVWASQKTMFGWDSFCVTPAAFMVKCIAIISYGLTAATPFTMLWCLSRKNYIPIPNPTARDGKFGGGRYVEFIQTWTWWLILAPTILGILWIQYIGKEGVSLSPAYLLHGLGVGLIIVIIIIKLIRNAIILRFRCYEVLLNKEYSEVERPPVDPTIDFLGTDWWKLPATIGVSLASIWAILEWLGVAKFIISIIR